tara:strand:- start:558 stop:2942 length:2385 start_codon:yes stop_codon:yes gene_type:complete
MARPIITSPGVEIRESDLSLTTPANVGTNIYITGFAQQGPCDEVLKITSKQELNQIFGTPTTSAERYFYYTINELLNSPGNVYASRLPYGVGTGDGFGAKYSALAYPVTARDVAGASPADLSIGGSLSGAYFLGAPTHIELSKTEYLSAIDGTGFDWSAAGSTAHTLTGALAGKGAIGNLGKAGLIILNKSQTTINNGFEGYYIGAIDNSSINPASNFEGVRSVRSLNVALDTNAPLTQTTIVPDSTLTFPITANYKTGRGNSISEVMENLTDYDIDNRQFDDYLNIGVFKLRKSIWSTAATKLDYVLSDGIVGSVNSRRMQNNPNGGVDQNIFLERVDENSRNVTLLVNDFVSGRLNGQTGLNAAGEVSKKIRMYSTDLEALTAGYTAAEYVPAAGTTAGALTSLAVVGGGAGTGFRKNDSLYPLGTYTNEVVTSKHIGNIPNKIDRALEGIKNDEIYDIDVVVEGGLGTIWSIASAANTAYYDEFDSSSAITAAVNGLRTSNAIAGTGLALRNDYSTIFNKFEQFVKPPYLGGSRGDCIFIADPIRQIFITGANTKVLDNKDNNFQTSIYWPIKHQFANENTSYAAVYGNWAQVYDGYSGQQVWVPFSGFAGAAMARTDAVDFPWFAPAGFSRGLLPFSNDIAVNPNQKQRDELYKANINPVAAFPGQGQVIFGQKTLNKKPSAFDRINVRRLFLALERPVKKASRFFVFEQNSEFTRTRVVNTLTPVFERAKNNEGLYDYLIVCDERNNTPTVIDANELVVDIYLKPTRTAEYILVNFYATRTDANFEELI